MEVDDDYDEDIDEIEVEAYTTDTYGNVITKREMAYDSMGRVTETRDCLPGWCSQTAADVYRTYSYNYASVMNAEKYSSVLGATAPNVGLSYSYNVAGQLTGVSGGQNNAPLTPSIWSATAIGPSGPTLAQFGNGLYGLNSYDSAGRVNSGSVCQGSSQSGCANGTTVYSFTDTVVGRQLNHSGDTVLGQQRDYTYDEFGRLQGLTTTANSGPAIGMNFGYDRYGNRMAQTMTAGSGPQPSFGFNSANNQVTGFSYDVAGNVIYDGQHSYTYDDENNLVEVDGGSTAIYQFDAFNQRVAENTSAGGLVLYGFDLNGRRSTQWSGGGELLQVQYYGQTGRLAYWSSTDSGIHFEHQDWLGTERMRTTASGSQDGSFSSLPFGDGASSSGHDTNAGHFATLDQNAGSSTSHAFNRDYNSLSGSWLSPDSYSGSYHFGSPQSFNRYNYTRNRPLLFVDPSGHDDGLDSGEGGDPCEEDEITCFVNPDGPQPGESNSLPVSYQSVTVTASPYDTYVDLASDLSFANWTIPFVPNNSLPIQNSSTSIMFQQSRPNSAKYDCAGQGGASTYGSCQFVCNGPGGRAVTDIPLYKIQQACETGYKGCPVIVDVNFREFDLFGLHTGVPNVVPNSCIYK